MQKEKLQTNPSWFQHLFIIQCTIHKSRNKSQGIFLIKAFAAHNIWYKKLN